MISIVIPTLNESVGNDTGKLAQLTAGCETRLIVSVDAHRRGFSKTVNAGLRQTDREDVCILNDDIGWFTYGWLNIMRRALRQGGSYGIAAPSGSSSTAPMRHGFPGMHGIDVVDHVPFWCALVKRVVFDRVGYLDESFIHYGSDNYMCWRAAQEGMECIWVKDVFLKHEHHGSGLITEWKEHDDMEMVKKNLRSWHSSTYLSARGRR